MKIRLPERPRAGTPRPRPRKALQTRPRLRRARPEKNEMKRNRLETLLYKAPLKRDSAKRNVKRLALAGIGEENE